MPLQDIPVNLEYRGRQTRRADGRARREAILEATLRLIEREGIRAVRHRAVALEANVPLAATTYYFNDLNDLISDAFTLFAERALATTRQLENEAFHALQQLREQSDEALLRAQLPDLLSRFLLAHIRKQVGNKAQRLLEHAFRQAAMRNEKLAADMLLPHNVNMTSIRRYFELLGSADARADAELVMAAIMHWEYQLLLHEAEDELWALAESSLLRLMQALLKLDAVPMR